MFSLYSSKIFFQRGIKLLRIKKHILIACVLIVSIFMVVISQKLIKHSCFAFYNTFDTTESQFLFNSEALSEWSPNGLIVNNINGYQEFIVPNIVHYILIDYNEINFAHYLSIKSVLKIQKPDKIVIHCNYDEIVGNYWIKLKEEYKDLQKIIHLHKVVKRDSVFGIKFSNVWHSSDVLRIMVLMEFGGIYLDRDVLILKSINKFRKFEMTVDYEVLTKDSKAMGNQIMIAHKRARFLRLYLKTYLKYDGSQWYWNAGWNPVLKIIDKYPHLVHTVNRSFGIGGPDMCKILYLDNINDWKDKYFAVHFLMRDNSIKGHKNWCFPDDRIPDLMKFNMENIKTFKTTFGQMARFILYDTIDVIGD